MSGNPMAALVAARELSLVQARIAARRRLRSLGDPVDQSHGQGVHGVAFRIGISGKHATIGTAAESQC